MAGSLAGIGALMAFAACGGSSDNGGTPEAGAPDVAVDHFVAPPVDAGIDSFVAPPVDAGCMAPDADLNTIGFPDAALDDAGATSNGCIACAHKDCQTYLDMCNADCPCKSLIVGVLECIDNDGGLNCASSVVGGGADMTAQNFGVCVYAGCRKECGIPSPPDGGPEAGTPEAGADAAGD